jgi:tripartite-type tricarboxylate transporter receptor subunit TctC
VHLTYDRGAQALQELHTFLPSGRQCHILKERCQHRRKPVLPPVAETIPGFQATGWAVLVAPIGTPEAIIDKISEDLRKVTLDPELQTKLAPLGSYTNPMSAAEATAFVHKQQQTWQPILDEIAKNQP